MKHEAVPTPGESGTWVAIAGPGTAGLAVDPTKPVRVVRVNDRDETIRVIRAELKRRSGKSWSVTGGRGTTWGWITITSPPKRSPGYGELSPEDQAELSVLLGKDVHHQGERIPASSAYRAEAVDRARGLTPAVVGTPYWD